MHDNTESFVLRDDSWLLLSVVLVTRSLLPQFPDRHIRICIFLHDLGA